VTYIVDTDQVASFLNGRAEAVARLGALVPQGLAISIVTYGEIYEGTYFGRQPAEDERAFRTFLGGGTRILALSRPIMRRFARLRGDLRRRGLLLPDPDLLIAATAMHHNLTLVTRNRAHFTRVAGLNLRA
jgi:tRNA(fMet)-specific endonuclease VapC